jgi:hypothetical protein
MDNVFNVGDKIIIIDKNIVIEKVIECITNSIVADRTGYCYEVVNFGFTDGSSFFGNCSEGKVYKIIEKFEGDLNNYEIKANIKIEK